MGLLAPGPCPKPEPKPKPRKQRKPYRRPVIDQVSADLVEHLWRRDKGCVAHLYLGAVGDCRNEFGARIGARRVDLMDVHHVKSEPRAGRRADSDAAHTMLVCPAAHEGGGFGGWIETRDGYAAARGYLARHIAAGTI